HTRLVSDWSSDVCSSDLLTAIASRRPRHRITSTQGEEAMDQIDRDPPVVVLLAAASDAGCCACPAPEASGFPLAFCESRERFRSSPPRTIATPVDSPYSPEDRT